MSNTEEKELTPREQALRVIQEGGSVTVNGVSYTLRGSENGVHNIKPYTELPGEEAFIGNNPELRASTLDKMANDLKEMTARYEALKKDPAPATSAKSAKVENSEEK